MDRDHFKYFCQSHTRQFAVCRYENILFEYETFFIFFAVKTQPCLNAKISQRNCNSYEISIICKLPYANHSLTQKQHTNLKPKCITYFTRLLYQRKYHSLFLCNDLYNTGNYILLMYTIFMIAFDMILDIDNDPGFSQNIGQKSNGVEFFNNQTNSNIKYMLH